MASCAPAGLELGVEVHGISWSGAPVFQDLLTVLGCFLTVWELTAMCSAGCNPFDCNWCALQVPSNSMCKPSPSVLNATLGAERIFRVMQDVHNTQ